MEKLLKGRPVADKIKEIVKEEVKNLREKGIKPKIKFIRVGEEAADLSYEKSAIKTMVDCGIEYEVLALPRDISEEDFIINLKSVNDDKTVHGILIFRPLPRQIDENKVKYIISPEKDIDCFNPINIGKVMEGDDTGFLPCTPAAVLEIIKYYNIDLKGKLAVVIGRSLVVGKPLSMLLLQEDATVTICHSKTKELQKIAREADLLVAAIGRAKMISSDYIKEGAVVIDVGINVDENNQIVGDVNTEDCIGKSSYITPVPKGVGSVTTSILASHLVKAALLTIGGKNKWIL